MKFSIRDLLLVTVIVAVCVAWWVDRSKLAHEIDLLKNLDLLTYKDADVGPIQGRIVSGDIYTYGRNANPNSSSPPQPKK